MSKMTVQALFGTNYLRPPAGTRIELRRDGHAAVRFLVDGKVLAAPRVNDRHIVIVCNLHKARSLRSAATEQLSRAGYPTKPFTCWNR